MYDMKGTKISMEKLMGEKIYILCPSYVKTGGTELLHQLAFQLKDIGFFVMMIYIENHNKKINVHPEFEFYNNAFSDIDSIEDSSENLIIAPEIYVLELNKFKKIKKAVWWLSVDFFEVTRNPLFCIKIKGLLKTIVRLPKYFKYPLRAVKEIPYHLCQSYYAVNYLEKHGIKSDSIEYLSDYLNETYLDDTNVIWEGRKKNIVYNPKKGKKFTEKLISYAPELNWVPLENMTTREVHNLLLESKIYIDFGNHPGKDRIPREAAISGCCVVTGKDGAAAYSQDLPISNDNKFDCIEENIPIIINRIKILLENYEEEILAFETYRSFIKKEKEGFLNCINKIFENELR